MGGLIAILTGLGPLLTQAGSLISALVTAKNNEEIAAINARLEALKGAYGLAATAAGQVIVIAFAAPIWVYLCKIVVWDKVLGDWTHGSTDALTGDVSVWVGIIITFLFGHGLLSRLKS